MSITILDTYAPHVLNAANHELPALVSEMTKYVRTLRDYFVELGPSRFQDVAVERS